jgi:LmbE family N-acetylglucosaminyl deacetylase
MIFHNATARLFVPDGEPDPLGRVTHLGIGAHQDDLEFMAFHGILACYHSTSEWFAGVTCTDGAESSRTGPYAEFSDAQMRAARSREQETAASVGRYAAMIQLDYPSRAVKSATDPALREDLGRILEATRPRVVYTHNLADKHETHIGVAVAALQAMRDLPAESRPRAVHGCEVWRGLDWMPDEDKIVHDVSAHENLAAALNGVFDSQIAGGKRYDLATLGRRRANATFFHARAADEARMISFAMDLTPLIADPALSISDYVEGYIAKFAADVRAKLAKRLADE